MTKLEKELAICQMQTIKMIFSGGGMDEDTAFSECSLLTQECLKLAESEGLDEIADFIRNNI